MRKELIKMVEQATTTTTSYYDGRGNVTENHFDKEKFASLVAKAAVEAEREACAKVCEDVFTKSQIPFLQGVFTPETCVYAIRARGETK